MGEMIDKVKGAANSAIGKAKVAAGKQTENAELVAKGTVQQIKGKAQTDIGEIKGAMGDKI